MIIIPDHSGKVMDTRVRGALLNHQSADGRLLLPHKCDLWEGMLVPISPHPEIPYLT